MTIHNLTPIAPTTTPDDRTCRADEPALCTTREDTAVAVLSYRCWKSLFASAALRQLCDCGVPGDVQYHGYDQCPLTSLTDPMTGADKPPVFTVASVLAQLMSRSTMTDDAQYFSPPPRSREPAMGRPRGPVSERSGPAQRMKSLDE